MKMVFSGQELADIVAAHVGKILGLNGTFDVEVNLIVNDGGDAHVEVETRERKQESGS